MIRLTSSMTDWDTVTFETKEPQHHVSNCLHSSAITTLFDQHKCQPTFFPDHRVLLVVGVVGVTELPVRAELELHELMTELAAVANAARHKADITATRTSATTTPVASCVHSPPVRTSSERRSRRRGASCRSPAYLSAVTSCTEYQPMKALWGHHISTNGKVPLPSSLMPIQLIPPAERRAARECCRVSFRD